MPEAPRNRAVALPAVVGVIDAEFQFSGVRANEGQALQWPRAE